MEWKRNRPPGQILYEYDEYEHEYEYKYDDDVILHQFIQNGQL
jgi:hypothetical protein